MLLLTRSRRTFSVDFPLQSPHRRLGNKRRQTYGLVVVRVGVIINPFFGINTPLLILQGLEVHSLRIYSPEGCRIVFEEILLVHFGKENISPPPRLKYFELLYCQFYLKPVMIRLAKHHSSWIYLVLEDFTRALWISARLSLEIPP